MWWWGGDEFRWTLGMGRGGGGVGEGGLGEGVSERERKSPLRSLRKMCL